MTKHPDDFQYQLKTTIESRVRDQLARHWRIDPNLNPKKIIDIQIRQEKERLEKMAEKFADDGQERLADLCEFLAEEWLPELRAKLLR